VIQRTAALRFFFVATLRRPWAIAETPYPRKTFRLPKILSPEQVSRLIDAAPTVFYRILLMTLYATGLRRAELAHLKVGDIDSERMVIHVKGGKGRKDRDVMLSPKLLDELRRYVRGLRQRPELWLFPGNRWHTGKRPITSKVIWEACREAATRAGLGDEIHPHTLRHASAYYTTFQSSFILKAIALGQAQSAAVYGRTGRLALAPARLAARGSFDR
jgi:integrase